MAKLETLGPLVERWQSTADRRLNEAVITSKGRAMTGKIDATRERIAAAFAS